MAKGSVKDLEASLKGYLQGFIPPKQDLGMDGLGALHRHLDELKRVYQQSALAVLRIHPVRDTCSCRISSCFANYPCCEWLYGVSIVVCARTGWRSRVLLWFNWEIDSGKKDCTNPKRSQEKEDKAQPICYGWVYCSVYILLLHNHAAVWLLSKYWPYTWL